jgi:hypothetical protein
MCEKNDGQRWDLPMKGKWLAYVEELYRCGQQDQYSGEIEGMRRVKFMISIFFFDIQQAQRIQVIKNMRDAAVLCSPTCLQRATYFSNS